MNIGLLYELPTLRLWEKDSEHLTIEGASVQVSVSDKLDGDEAWAVEHHFVEGARGCVVATTEIVQGLHPTEVTMPSSMAGIAPRIGQADDERGVHVLLVPRPSRCQTILISSGARSGERSGDRGGELQRDAP